MFNLFILSQNNQQDITLLRSKQLEVSHFALNIINIIKLTVT